jgi:hypothetical protein
MGVNPSPGRSSFHSDRPPSPARGEGKRVCCRASQQSHKGGGETSMRLGQTVSRFGFAGTCSRSRGRLTGLGCLRSSPLPVNPGVFPGLAIRMIGPSRKHPTWTGMIGPSRKHPTWTGRGKARPRSAPLSAFGTARRFRRTARAGTWRRAASSGGYIDHARAI